MHSESLKRHIPVLLLDGVKLVKTIRFGKNIYLGDPINAVKIFNDKGADELIILDINSSKHKKGIQWNLLQDIASEAFMPLSYGGGISEFSQAKKLFSIGFEKIILNTHVFDNTELISSISKVFGSQSVVVCIDYKKNLFGKNFVFINSGRKKTTKTPQVWAEEVVNYGAGEIILQSIDNDGTWDGYDIDMIKQIVPRVTVPVIPLGGCGIRKHFIDAFTNGAHAVAAGSYFVFTGKEKGILINYNI